MVELRAQLPPFQPFLKRFPAILCTCPVLGTRGEDVDQLVACVQSKLPVLTCTLQLREEFKQEVEATAGLLYVDDPNWPGIGVVRYGKTEGESFCEPAEKSKVNMCSHSTRV